MRPYFFLNFALVLTFSVNAQTEINWLKKEIVPINIDLSKEDFSNFSKVKKSIGNATIVLLGEQSHGDATTFEAKIQLVKFLHQEMGFNVLAFESNQYNAERAWQDVAENKNPLTALQNSTFPIWGKAKEMQPLFKYISSQANTKKPLRISGFDCQPEGKYVMDSFEQDFSNYLISKNLNFTDSAEKRDFFKTFNAFLFEKGYELKNKSFQEKLRIWDSLKKEKPKFLAVIDTKIAELSKIKESKAKLFLQFLISTKNYLPLILYFNAIDKTNRAISKNLRDSLMAENIIWLANEYYPKQKIIIWAASYHLAKHKTLGYGNLIETLVGDYIRKALDNKTYTIAFTAYEGNIGWFNAKDSTVLPKPPDNSFEYLFNQTGKEVFFLDFKTNSRSEAGKWLMTPRYMRPLGYMNQEKSWPLVFDAIVFTKGMKRVHKVEE